MSTSDKNNRRQNATRKPRYFKKPSILCPHSGGRQQTPPRGQGRTEEETANPPLQVRTDSGLLCHLDSAWPYYAPSACTSFSRREAPRHLCPTCPGASAPCCLHPEGQMRGHHPSPCGTRGPWNRVICLHFAAGAHGGVSSVATGGGGGEGESEGVSRAEECGTPGAPGSPEHCLRWPRSFRLDPRAEHSSHLARPLHARRQDGEGDAVRTVT